MTLRSDVAELLAGAGILDVDIDDAVADEHVRSSAYRRVVSAAASARSRDGDRALVATLLRDPHDMGARTAVIALVDEIARKASGPAEFGQWSAGLLPEIDRNGTEKFREFIHRRIHDWLFHLSLRDGHRPPGDLGRAGEGLGLDAARPRRGVDVTGGTRSARRVGQRQEDT